MVYSCISQDMHLTVNLPSILDCWKASLTPLLIGFTRFPNHHKDGTPFAQRLAITFSSSISFRLGQANGTLPQCSSDMASPS
jgi:hypothetical protein